jgi:hypothetical protein
MGKTHKVRKQSKLLVESILDKDPISANSIFQKLIAECDARRTRAIIAEAEGEDEDFDMDFSEEEIEDTGAEETAGDEDFDAGAEGEVDEFGGEADETVEGLESDEADKIIDDIVEINCQINAKMISALFDKIAEIKNKVNALGLDTSSREYLKYDVTVQYYADKLQSLQGKTNPGIDQSKVETALNKIDEAIKQILGELGGDDVSVEEEITDIDSPEEVAAVNDLGDSSEDLETEEEADVEETETAEGETEEVEEFEETEEEPAEGETEEVEEEL